MLITQTASTMVISPALTDGEWRYRIEYDNGTIEEDAQAIPDAFGPCRTGTVFDKKISPSEHALLIASQLRTAPNDPGDFIRLIESREFADRLSSLSGIDRQAFVLTLLQWAEEVYDLSEPVAQSHPIARFVNDTCRPLLFEHWASEVSSDRKMYNFAGVFAQLESMEGEGPEAQCRFLERIISEHHEPMACEFPAHSGGQNNSTPFITILYPHAFSYRELEFIRQRLSALRRDLEAGEGSRSGSDVVPLPEWNGLLTDLVFIFDALEDAGYLTTTDASIMAHINVRSNAKDRAKVYRNTRKKLQDGMAYPDNARLERLIEQLRKGMP